MDRSVLSVGSRVWRISIELKKKKKKERLGKGKSLLRGRKKGGKREEALRVDRGTENHLNDKLGLRAKRLMNPIRNLNPRPFSLSRKDQLFEEVIEGGWKSHRSNPFPFQCITNERPSL